MAFSAFSTRGMDDDEELNAAPMRGVGLLGGGDEEGGLRGLLGGVGSKFADNSNLMSALGFALMSGSRNNPFENMNTALSTGGTMDARAQKARQEQMDKLAAQRARRDAADKAGLNPDLAATEPELFRSQYGIRNNPNTAFDQEMRRRADSRADEQLYQTTQVTDAQRSARDLGLRPGTPEFSEHMVRAYRDKGGKNAQIVTDQNGGQHYVNPDDPSNPVPLNFQGGAAAAAPGVTGDEYLKTLDPARAGQIKAIAEGRMQPPATFALKTPYWQQMMRDVGTYEPGFDMTLWKRRNETQADFGKGKSAQNITSLNTVLGHMDDLGKAGDALNNTNYPKWNAIANAYIDNTGDPRVKNFQVTRNAVADEMAKVFRQTGMSDAEINSWKGTLNEANSPAQLNGVLKTGVSLIESRLNAVGDQYNRGMGRSVEPASLLSPKAQQTLENIRRRVNGGGEGSPSGAAPAAAAPAPSGHSRADLEAEARRRGLIQ